MQQALGTDAGQPRGYESSGPAQQQRDQQKQQKQQQAAAAAAPSQAPPQQAESEEMRSAVADFVSDVLRWGGWLLFPFVAAGSGVCLPGCLDVLRLPGCLDVLGALFSQTCLA